ncbi:hypothetical protein HZR00_17230 [Elizabethkingia anophelis]|nr:hypothetical protein [Elizabethkingia anophelis]
MNFLNETNYKYLCEGLTYELQDWEMLDQLLAKFNKQNGFIDRIVEGNNLNGYGNDSTLAGPEIIFNMDVFYHQEKGKMSVVNVGMNKIKNNVPPQLHLNLRSPSLDVPQRIEIPLKYVLKGLPPLTGTHMVYLHAIGLNDGSKHVYYGRTKRGWMKRFNEHVKLAMKGSNRKFPLLFGGAILARYNQLLQKHNCENDLVYNESHHVVCVAGLDKDTVIAAERYLINKYSLGAENGLNMI